MKIPIIISSVIIGISMIISSCVIANQIYKSTNEITASITNQNERKVQISGGIGVTQREPIKFGW